VVDAAGWRSAYLMMGCAIVVTPLPFLVFALPRGRLQPRDSAAAKRPRPDLRQELRRPGMLPLAGVLVLPGLASFGMQVHPVPYLSDLGHATTLAAAALGAMVGISALGKLGGGLVGDRLGPLPTLRLALALEVVAVVLLALAASPLLVALFVAAHGIAFGAQIAVVPVIALAILGHERFATLFGMLQLGATLTIGLAPIVPGIIVDATGSYAGAVLFWGGVMLLALWISARARIPLREEGDAAAGAELQGADRVGTHPG
jgi:MFS family permease